MLPMLPILQVGDVLLSPDIFTEHFCCDLAACGGACCVEGEAGAPVTAEECRELERVLPAVRMQLSPNYHRWSVCAPAVAKGRELRLPIYRFLREPLIRRFGEAWYAELETLADLLRQEGLIKD